MTSAPSSNILFSSFVSLAAGVASNISSSEAGSKLMFKDLGVMNQHLILLGQGSSFMVSVFPDHEETDNGLKRLVLKRTIPLAKKQHEEIYRNHIRAMMLELQTLVHDAVRKHENIVNLLGLAWETDPFDMERKWPVFLMERATKGTLSDLFQAESHFTSPIRLNLILDVVLGLEVLHLCGIIHGDVKLENVLVFENTGNNIVDRPYIAKLADFSSSLFGVFTPSRLSSGTQPWKAPEWHKQLDPKALQLTDIYSLGFAIWRIFADGKHPFLRHQVNTPKTWLKEVEDLKVNDGDMRDYLIQNSEFETEVERYLMEEIMMRTVRVDPAHRSVVEVKHLLQKAVQHPR
jgi:serine/threonine protein kinase